MKADTKTTDEAKWADDDARWQSVCARHAEADGHFYYAVQTTGIYCYPSCSARLPQRQHVQFFWDRLTARQAGFRPCKRCCPDQDPPAVRHAQCILRACRQIERAPQSLSLAQLAASVALSPAHFHRLFKRIMGVTPHAYATALRHNKMRGALASPKQSITDLILEAGYNSSAPFYAEAFKTLGMTPGCYRQGGQDMQIRFAIGPCQLGLMLVAQSTLGVCAVFLGDEAEALEQALKKRFAKADLKKDELDFLPVLTQVIAWVESQNPALAMPLDIRGTVFQQQVWQALCNIPVGQTSTYADVAMQIGSPAAVRAVAGACAANPVAVLIPCHRVLRRDGALSGYRWGIDRKRALLQVEAEAHAKTPLQSKSASTPESPAKIKNC